VGDRYRERFAARLAGKVDNVPVGLAELDAALTWGWHPGHVTVLCGRPSCGKSSFAYNVAKWWVDACDRGRHPDPRPLLFCPLEMGNEAAQDALVARAAGLDVTRLVKDARGLSLAEQASVASAVDRYAAGPWTAWFDEPGASLERVEEVLSAASVPDGRGGARSRYGLVVVDLFDKTLPDLRPETITSALNRAQAAARTHGTHLLLLAQIRRGVEKRGDKRPTREDLKGSGGFEEVADQILCVHRERVYDPDLEDDTMEVGVLKQRLGPFGQWLTYAYDAPRFAVGAFRESSQE
jgi:replicative DNA helicase